jgi:hypothetical protein
MPTAGTAANPRLLHAAARLLRAALGPQAECALSDGGRGRLRLDCRSTAVPSQDLVLRPWSGDEIDTPERSSPHLIWVTRRADARTRELLRRQDRSFIDLASRTVRLHLPGFLVDRNGVSPERPPRTARTERSPYGDLGSMVTRTLLAEPGRDWTLSQLTAGAGVSKALASRVVGHLREASLIQAGRLGRTLRICLSDPWPLFLRWTGQYRWTDNPTLAVAAPIGDAGRFLPKLRHLLGTQARWALTLHAGASLMGRHAVWDTIHVYVDRRTTAELRGLADRMGWEPSPHGRLVLMAPKYRRAVWRGLVRQPTASVPTVDPIQLMLDLWHYPVRGREQAEHLARVLKWRALPQ